MKTYKDLLAHARLHAGFHHEADVTLSAIVRTMPSFSTTELRSIASAMAEHIQAVEDKRLADEAIAKEVAIKERRERGAKVYEQIRELRAIIGSRTPGSLDAHIAFKCSKEELEDLLAWMYHVGLHVPPALPLKFIQVHGIEVIER